MSETSKGQVMPQGLEHLKVLGSGLNEHSPCATERRSGGPRQDLPKLMSRVEELGICCWLKYSTEGEYEYVTLVCQRPKAEPETIRYGWRSGELDNESIAHVWLWMALNQVEGDSLAARRAIQP